MTFNFSVSKALLNALHSGDKFCKIPAETSSNQGPVLVSWYNLLFVAKVNLYLFQGKRSGLHDTAKFKGKVSLTV